MDRELIVDSSPATFTWLIDPTPPLVDVVAPPPFHTLYGPPDHLPGTIHRTHQDAREDPHED